ncbi:acetyltransferase [Azospirillum sp. B510]|uniref:GNAT family N-acetyltransferase n=1 Tax=Azospirillum sp. (strain B510) TaxID=137722 RepID=UPI0001C4C409|nr:N-acetyltransferase [Azospirillum sp. B510]BAI72058.1 acetyltransferase [Azospirillum sp. B510]
MLHETDPVHCDAARIGIRPAELADLPALLAIEERSFATDRMTPRNFRYAVEKAKGVVLVACRQAVTGPGQAVGYGVVAFHAGTPFARLTSFAVAPGTRGQGVGRRLLAALEKAAAAHGCIGVRLEVRADNAAAIALYGSAGYRRFAIHPDYYEDGMAALRLQKPLAFHGRP